MFDNVWSLQDLFEGWLSLQAEHASISISGLSIDSRLTQVGDLFIALRGQEQHGLRYSKHAISNGAVAIAWESDAEVNLSDLTNEIPYIEISNLHSKLGLISQRFYDDASRKMNVIGVTGTDGKTSVTQFIAQAFQYLDTPCGAIGTLGYGIYPNYDEASHTTPDVIRIHGLLHKYYSSNVKNAVIEASSHGLVQGRLDGVHFNTAVFTNLGRDHLDYHSSIEEYGDAKKLLFESKDLQNAIINIDDAFGKKIANQFSDSLKVIGYSIEADADINQLDAYLKACNIKYHSNEMHFDIVSSWGSASIKTKLIGSFNISNLLAVLGVLLASDIDFSQAVKVIENIKTAAGRMDFIHHDESHIQTSPAIVIDYAHTPQALENVLTVLHEQCKGKLYCVFGCGGDRDQGKRVLMAQAVERYANYAVLTDDNPRFEDPVAITSEVEAGFSSSYSYKLIHDRYAAIKFALAHADAQDTVLIAGKGHEAVQIIEDKKYPFDDKKIAQEIIMSI